MHEILNKPYYSYNNIVDTLFEPIRAHANIKPLTFARYFNNNQRFLICNNTIWANSYFSHEFYLYGIFERMAPTFKSGFYMWDHLGCDPNGIYEHSRRTLSIAHGLTILQHHSNHFDFFLFTTIPNNSQVNNFYLNHKELFSKYMSDFYSTFDSIFDDLSHHTIYIPINTSNMCNLSPLSPRQQDCAILMAKGFTTKEIARQLQLSPRTIEEHINNLKIKFNAKNRIQLSGILQKYI